MKTRLCHLHWLSFQKYQRCGWVEDIVFQAGNCMFKFNNRNTRARCEICSRLTIKAPERRQLSRSDVFIVNFEYISHLVLVFPLLTLSKEMPAGLVPFFHLLVSVTFAILFGLTFLKKVIRQVEVLPLSLFAVIIVYFILIILNNEHINIIR